MQIPDSRNLPLMPEGLLHLPSVPVVFPASANPGDSTLHTGLQWEKVVSQTGRRFRENLSDRQGPFQHSSPLRPDPLSWILHHRCHSDLRSSPDPSVTQLPLTRGGENRTGRFGLDYQRHHEEATLSGRLRVESA